MVTNKLPQTEKMVLAPIDQKLNVDNEFALFCFNRIQTVEVTQGEILTIAILQHKIRFRVKSCVPEKSVVGIDTKLNVLPFDTRSNMTVDEAGINIFMSDEELKKILSALVREIIITEQNAIQIWSTVRAKQRINLK